MDDISQTVVELSDLEIEMVQGCGTAYDWGLSHGRYIRQKLADFFHENWVCSTW